MSLHKETPAQVKAWKDAYINTNIGGETESIVLDLADLLDLVNLINQYNATPASNGNSINAVQLHLVRQNSSSFFTTANGEKQLNIVINPIINFDKNINDSGIPYKDSNNDIPTIYAVDGGENGGLCPPKYHGII